MANEGMEGDAGCWVRSAFDGELQWFLVIHVNHESKKLRWFAFVARNEEGIIIEAQALLVACSHLSPAHAFNG